MNFAPFAYLNKVVSGPSPLDPLPSGVIMYYDPGNVNSYIGSGTTMYDLSGNNYTASINSNITYSSSNGGYFNLNGNDNVSITGGTINETLTSWTMYIAVFRSNIGSYDGFMFSRRSPGNANGLGAFSTTQRLSTIVNNGTEIIQPTTPSTALMVNSQWMLLSSGVDSTTGFRQIFRSTGQNYQTFTKASGSSIFDFPIELGHDAEPGGDRAMQGRIGVAVMWNKKLTESELTQTNNYFKSRYGY